jgi:protein-disulfide isomerase
MPFFVTLLSALVISLVPAFASAADAAPFTDSQKAAIEEVVRDLLTKKEPNIIIEAAQAVQQKSATELSQKSQKALASNRDKIFNNPDAPIGGNPKGDVTVVEFYDYRCGYCKVVEPSVAQLLEQDKNVKFVFMEFPILGPQSMQAAKASLASVRQGKFAAFHKAMMGTKENLTDDVIFKVAKTAGLNVDKLKKDMADEKIEKIIKENIALGNEVGAHGTPTFIVGDQVVPGALPLENLKSMIADARKKKKK